MQKVLSRFKNGVSGIVLLIIVFFLSLAVALSFFIYISERSVISFIVEKNIDNVSLALDKNKEQTLRYLKFEMKQNSKSLADASAPYILKNDLPNLRYLLWPFTKNMRIKMIEIRGSKGAIISFYKNGESPVIAREIPSSFLHSSYKHESSDIILNGKSVGSVSVFYQGGAIEAALESEKASLISKLVTFTPSLKSGASDIFFRHFMILFFILFIVFTAASFVVAVYYRKNQEQVRLTYEKNIELTIALDTLKNTQKQLVESEKLASLGSLVSGISHEINNPVGVALTAVTSLKSRSNKIRERLDSGELTDIDINNYIEYTKEAVEIAHRNLRLTSDLVKSFKDISTDQQSGQKRDVLLKEYLEEIFRSLSPEFKHKKHSYIIDCNDSISITTFPGAWFQVFANLTVNSFKHGFKNKESGVISVSVLKRSENTVQIVYQDNGDGISEDVIGKIFDPFFTTSRGQGSGLGLSIVYSIVTQKLRGVITAGNSFDGGAKFIITVPVKI